MKHSFKKTFMFVLTLLALTFSALGVTPAMAAIDATSFAAKVDFNAGSFPEGVATGDFDGDGKPDLAVTNFTNNIVSVLRNTSTSGTVTFAAKVEFPAGTGPLYLAIGDLDGDGKPDLAVTNNGSATVSVLRNTSTSGTVSFAAKVDFTTGAGPHDVAIGDLDGDGKPDLAVTNNSLLSVFRNTSTSGAITAGSFAAKVDFTTGALPQSVAIGDLDGDGKPDLAVTIGNSNTISVLRNTSTSGAITVSSFAAKVDFTTGTTPRGVAIGDLDGDGKSDLAVANFDSNTVSVFRNTSTSGVITASSFAAKVDFTTGTNPGGIAIGDLDGDSKRDLAVTNINSATISVFRNTSTSGTIDGTSFAAKVDFTAGTVPQSIAIDDLDKDGKPDLAVANLQDTTVSVFRNTLEGILPVVDTFTITAPSNSVNIPITAFTASDNAGVTGYMITTSAIAPLAGASGWSATAPTTYTVAGDGSYTLYPWAKDAAGNVSAVFGTPRAVTVTIPAATTLVNSVLPTSRSVPVNTLATIFNTVLNGGTTTATGVTLSISPAPAGVFAYQQTNCATNAIIGGLNPSLDVDPGQALCYVLSFTPSAVFPATSVHIRATAANAPSTNLLTGINTWLLRSTAAAGPDIIALTTTTDFHQVACSGMNAFAVALSNVGAAATGNITVSANTGLASLPVAVLIQETDPATGVVIGTDILSNVTAGNNRTVAVFVTFNGCIAFDPAVNRIFIEFKDASGNVVGSTSTAVSTGR